MDSLFLKSLVGKKAREAEALIKAEGYKYRPLASGVAYNWIAQEKTIITEEKEGVVLSADIGDLVELSDYEELYETGFE